MAKIFDIVLLVGGGAALWYAYKKGYLDDILGQLGGGGGGNGGATEPEPAPAEEPKKDEKAAAEEEEPAPKKEEKPKKKSKLALAYMGTYYDGTVRDSAYYVYNYLR